MSPVRVDAVTAEHEHSGEAQHGVLLWPDELVEPGATAMRDDGRTGVVLDWVERQQPALDDQGPRACK